MNPVVEEERTCAEPFQFQTPIPPASPPAAGQAGQGQGNRSERKIKAMAGRPNALPDLIYMAEKDAARVRQAIADHYGFVVTLAYAADLIAFVEAMLVEGK